MKPDASMTAWRRYMSEVYYDLDIKACRTDHLAGSLKEVNLGLFSISAVTTDAQRVVRSASAAKQDKSEDFVFVFQKTASLRYRQGNRAGTLTSGDVLLLNSAEAYDCDVQNSCENIALKVPCSLLRPNLKAFDASSGRVGIADPEILPIVSNLASHLLSSEASEAALRLQGTCLDLLTLMMDAGYRSMPGARRSSVLSDVLHGNLRAAMRRSLSNPDTTIETVAALCRVPVRTAQHVFQRRDTTFGRELMRMRLEEADRLLRLSPRSLSIGQIAYHCGFVNQGHFSTRYRQQFGLTPREVWGSARRD